MLNDCLEEQNIDYSFDLLLGMILVERTIENFERIRSPGRKTSKPSPPIPRTFSLNERTMQNERVCILMDKSARTESSAS